MIKILSISDVITNSSSEVFIVHAKPEYQDEINSEIPELIENLCNALELNMNNMLEFDISNDSYINEDWHYHVAKNDLLIYSAYENSMPYWLMDFIEDLYNFPKFEDKFYGYYAEDLGVMDLPYYDWNEKDYAKKLKIKPQRIQSINRVHLG